MQKMKNNSHGPHFITKPLCLTEVKACPALVYYSLQVLDPTGVSNFLRCLVIYQSYVCAALS
jgi:hypothetical protein